MPTANPAPPAIVAEIETALHALHIYGAAGIAAFGWAMGWLLETDARHRVPLWFCGGESDCEHDDEPDLPPSQRTR